MRGLRSTALLGLLTAGTALASAPAPPAAQAAAGLGPEQRQVFFGELHLHTTLSFDAWTFGTKVTPDMAYKFARGERVRVPAVQVSRQQRLPASAEVAAQRAWPLDFAAVTDHAEYMGAAHQLDDAGSAFSQTELGKQIRQFAMRPPGQGALGGFRVWAQAMRSDTAARQALMAAAAASGAWSLEIKAANDNYEPGRFTTFIAYEWTATAGYGTHMHRNVIFDSDHAPAPFTSIDSSRPEDLWKYLESVRRQGIGVLAIPHNSNLSDGHDFDWNMSDGRSINEAYALERALNEPLVEIAQLKGTSETTPELSPSDEFANFEILERLYGSETRPQQHGSYVREAYGRGLVIQERVGTNPFKMGIVGASDIHNGLSASDENAYASGVSGLDPSTMLPTGDAARSALNMGPDITPTERSGRARSRNDRLQLSGAAITGVWAQANTRAAIFAALRRKETFATSGTRIRLRMFGGWDFGTTVLGSSTWVSAAYAHGVPMGGDLPARPVAVRAPTLLLQAQKDPDGANLDRIQVIKIWLDRDDYHEKVFDAVLSGKRRDDASGHAPPVGDTVDLTTGTYQNTIGAATLSGVWQDPQFDPAVAAVYYARVLEIPTPRWSTLLAIKSHLPLPKAAPATIQERAWSSPIWFTPSGSRAHKRGSPGAGTPPR